MKVCVITGTRAEYGLLYWLIKEFQNDDFFQVQIIATGMHLSPEFGLTYKEIEKEFKINKKIEILLSSDTPVGISKSMGLAQISFAEAYEELKPDLILVLGDRYEIFSAVSSAMICRIPVAHLHGGEATQGLIDEAIRHALTKMSHIHFTATEEYRKRVIQLGENPNRVFNVGGLGIDNIKKLKLLNKEDFEKSIGFKLNKRNLLVTFHPVTLENNSSKSQFNELLTAFDELTDTNIIFTKANSDTNGRIINEMIDEYVSNNKNCIAFPSLGQLRYLSALQYVDAVVGNSSSGILEVPSFKIATINIGDRQKGRIKAQSVVDINPLKKEILRALESIYTKDFKEMLKNVSNPYGEGGSTEQIKSIIKNTKLNNILKKEFYDIKD
ncbi:UDP-N-acetylglucosamine 2-epimerase [Aliarcobacter butzleri]|uniref:UDP-N-acetylglucosamine 2-epimerase n=1 Tax=Aliarcobacter butzleri TaxID=28197 RepID=UPI000DB834F6|nr:UDP-N-acetylglucosamine 2-epimerase [Aliarcobacter butzleri]MDN5062007.1 UDP-N-acetylglucosamine 2-epimerase [Aliarcobacter butzleri]PZQ05889.1 MAG: UDP-N-acetylglucosamine 2-epimerase (hydrolyzing) [Aliarcobacter butzleri]